MQTRSVTMKTTKQCEETPVSFASVFSIVYCTDAP